MDTPQWLWCRLSLLRDAIARWNNTILCAIEVLRDKANLLGGDVSQVAFWNKVVKRCFFPRWIREWQIQIKGLLLVSSCGTKHAAKGLFDCEQWSFASLPHRHKPRSLPGFFWPNSEGGFHPFYQPLPVWKMLLHARATKTARIGTYQKGQQVIHNWIVQIVVQPYIRQG